MKISLLIMCTFIFSTGVFALDYKEAKSQGLVEELSSGYLVAKDTKASAIVKKVNVKRKLHYAKIAKQNGLDISAVAAKAAIKLKAK